MKKILFASLFLVAFNANAALVVGIGGDWQPGYMFAIADREIPPESVKQSFLNLSLSYAPLDSVGEYFIDFDTDFNMYEFRSGLKFFFYKGEVFDWYVQFHFANQSFEDTSLMTGGMGTGFRFWFMDRGLGVELFSATDVYVDVADKITFGEEAEGSWVTALISPVVGMRALWRF